MEDNLQAMEVYQQTMEDNQQMLEGKQKTMEDVKEIMEDNQQTLEDNQQTLEDNHQGMEDNQQTMEDDQQTIENNWQTMEDNQQFNNLIYPCNECGKIFSEKEKLRNHKSYTHRIEVSVCQICGDEFKNKQKLQRHINAVHKDQEKNCEICGMIFKNHTLLYGHKKGVHEVTEGLSCPTCGIEIMNFYKLRKHLKKCRGYKPTQDNLNCISCNKTFESIKSLKGHIKFVHFYNPVKCPICNVDSKNISRFRQHLNRAHQIIDHNRIVALIKDAKPEFEEVIRRKRINNSSHEKNAQDSTNLSKHQKQRSELVKKWKEIESEQNKITDARKIALELDENKTGIKNLTQDIKIEEAFNLKSEASDDFEKNIESKDELFTKNQRHKCVECGKLFSRSDKLNSHKKLVHTYEPCICPFCGTKTLKNKSYLAKHIKKDHTDFKIPKEETNTFNEEEKIKINQVLLNETAEMQKTPKTENIFEPCSCPFCEGTILKNQTYLIKHLKQFHKNYILPKENINNVHEEEEIKLNQDPLDGFVKTWQDEWNARIDDENNSEEMQDLKLEALIPEIELSEKNNVEEIKDLKLEASKEFGTWENDLHTIKTEGDEDIDKEIVKKENKDYIEDDINSSQIKLEKSFICDFCGKGFEKNCLLRRHMLVHDDVKPFCCDDCPKTFTSKGAVNYHKLSHTNEKPFMCDICSQTFTTKNTFEKHKLIHTGEKPFQCVDCGQSFRLKDSLNTHKKKFHTNEKPFICDICSQTFVSKFKFEQHKLIHTGEKPHQCDECEASFRLKFVMKKHKKKIHRDQVDPLCPLCGKSFKKKMALGGHMASAHPSEKQCRICSICDQECKNASSLKQHQRKHTEQGDVECVCSECGKICKSKSALYNHNYHTHMTQNVACPSCGKTCKNKVALRRHINHSCVSAFNSVGDDAVIY